MQPSAAASQSDRQSHWGEISYWYGATYKTPFVLAPNSANAAPIARNSFEYTNNLRSHLGSTLIDATVNQSNLAEPAASGSTGATELYLAARTNLGFNQLSDTRRFDIGPIRDVALDLGVDFEQKNSSFGPAERTLYAGPLIRLKIPRGFFNVAFHARKEWNKEDILHKSEHYAPNFNIEPAWTLPFSVGKLRLASNGFADFNTPKGTNSFGDQTVAEFIVRSSISTDIGATLLHRAQLVDLNAGLWYWHNEYGNPSADPGAHELTPIVGISIHLDGGSATHAN